MKSAIKTLTTIILVLTLLFAATVPSLASGTNSSILYTTDEIVEYVLSMAGERESVISFTLPNDLPEASMDSADLYRYIFSQCSGFTRWGCKGAAIDRKTGDNGFTTITYMIQYRSTTEQDNTARGLVTSEVAKWGVEELSELQKIEALTNYFSQNLRYDETLENITAYSTLTEKKGTCLGLTVAAQLFLDEMGVPSQTIHGNMKDKGTLHIWLIVKIGDWWYTIDPTWLAHSEPDLSLHLKDSHGDDRQPADEYLTQDFRLTFPMKEESAKKAA